MAQVLRHRGRRAKLEREVRLLRSLPAEEGRGRSIREAWDSYLEDIGSEMTLSQLLEVNDQQRQQKYENMLSQEYNISAAEAKQIMEAAMLSHERKAAPRKINQQFR